MSSIRINTDTTALKFTLAKIQAGLMTINEARQLHGLRPVPREGEAITKVACEYCLSGWREDERGNCFACGAPCGVG